MCDEVKLVRSSRLVVGRQNLQRLLAEADLNVHSL